MTPPTLSVIDPGPGRPFEIAHPHPSLRFALNECNGTYWVPGQGGHWEIAPTPFAALAALDSFTIPTPPLRLCTLAEHARAIRDKTLPIPRISHEDLAGRGAVTAPWSHQASTLEWLLAQTTAPGSGALLYLGMGTGKTRIVLDWIRLKHIRRTLVIAPKSVLPAWKSESEDHYGSTFSIWVSSLSDTALTGHQVDRARKFLSETTKPALVVVNYDRIWRTEMARFIDTSDFEAVVADECHKLKGRSSRRSLYLRSAWKRHNYRIALTGTPLSNGVLTDAFGQYAFLDPGLYGGSITRFEDRYAVKHHNHRWLVLGWRNTEDFYRRFWSIARHEDRSVLTLPEITETTRTVHLPQEARRAYAAMRDDLIVQIRQGIITASNAAVALSKLQQMANGTVIATDGSNLRVHNEKQSALEDILRETGDSPVVVFALFRNDLAAVHDAAREVNLTSLELSGSRDELARWQSGEATVLAVQVQSGSEGISLVRAQYGVFFSPTYNLSQMDQAKARLHRPGQNHPVTILHLIADQTVDVAVQRSLSKKQNFVQSLLDSRGAILVSLDN